MKAFIFDMDGTLFQTDTILEPALRDTFEYLHIRGQWIGEVPIEKYREIMGVPLPVVWETLLPEHSAEIRKVVDEYFLRKLISHINAGNGKLYEGVEVVFHQLKKEGHAIYIASNGLVDYLEAIVNYYQLDRWVTETFSIQQVNTNHKSDLVGLIKRKHGIEEGAVVGDRLSDIQAAKDNGLTAIGCQFDFAKDEELSQADQVIQHLKELLS